MKIKEWLGVRVYESETERKGSESIVLCVASVVFVNILIVSVDDAERIEAWMVQVEQGRSNAFVIIVAGWRRVEGW